MANGKYPGPLVTPINVAARMRLVSLDSDEPNQALQPTPSRLVSSLHMIRMLKEVATRALARRD